MLSLVLYACILQIGRAQYLISVELLDVYSKEGLIKGSIKEVRSEGFEVM